MIPKSTTNYQLTLAGEHWDATINDCNLPGITLDVTFIESILSLLVIHNSSDNEEIPYKSTCH